MRLLFIAALAGATLAAAPAMAWNDNMTQPASNEIAVWAYPSQVNYCPAGLQPVRIGGVICCGQPTHVGYQSHTPRRSTVVYGKGYDGTVVVYEKGQ